MQSLETITINHVNYAVKSGDFIQCYHKGYENLRIYPEVGRFERLVGLLRDLATDVLGQPNKQPLNLLLNIDNYHSQYVYYLHRYFELISVITPDKDNLRVLQTNLASFKDISNVVIVHECTQPVHIAFLDQPDTTSKLTYKMFNVQTTFVLGPTNDFTLQNSYKLSYPLSNTNLSLYIPSNYQYKFQEEFFYYIRDDKQELDYDNLINLCIMVKNGGEQFRNMLVENLPFVDRWTILDTGSTDDTVKYINEVLVGKKKGKLFEEPFINFRESRNRCLELAGETCKYNIMIDDTYILKGELRDFLQTIRGDQFADSYSLLIQSYDSEYYSNRITKSEKKLRYIYTIHEVIQKDDNINVVTPPKKAWIYDVRTDYMEKRTKDRKLYDLKCLFEMVDEYPDDPRHLYYIAQTYNCLDNHEKAAEYFYKRAFHKEVGFDQERIDALFEMTRIYNFKMNKPWEECEKYYKMVYELDKERPEGPYFIGVHYYLEGKKDVAFEWMKLAFEVGYPVHRQYSLKPTLSFHFTPKFLAELSYMFKDFALGKKCCDVFLQNNKPTDDAYGMMQQWNSIFECLLRMAPLAATPQVNTNAPIFCFVADGGFEAWQGSTILGKGVGGSETYIIEMARYIKQLTNYEVVVFCRCEKEEVFEGVKYVRLDRFFDVVANQQIEHCVISRYSEYIPVAIEGYVENIYVVLHDLGLTGEIIPVHEKIKSIFCLTEWHKEHFLKSFPQFKDRTHSFHYGIDFTRFLQPKQRVPQRFIYSSFPNRGLIIILKMWPKILAKYPNASLHIYTDVYNKWANAHYKDELIEVRRLLEAYKQADNGSNIVNHGWVSKAELADAWNQADIWFYPCKFKETFCLTALEAALTKTLVITNDLAALRDTVGSRGIVVPGSAETDAWQDKAFQYICSYFDNDTVYEDLIMSNYEWARKHSWKDRAELLLKQYIFPNDTLLFKVVGESEQEYEDSEGKQMVLPSANNSQVKQQQVKLKSTVWNPITEVIDYAAKQVEALKLRSKHTLRVLEVGPGRIRFKPATHIVDFCKEVARQLPPEIEFVQADVSYDRLPFADKYFDYVYCRHVIEDLQNPKFAMQELIRVSKNGFIETPSPLVELCRGIDADTKLKKKYRGYCHHFSIVYVRDGTLHILPKLPIVEHLDIDTDSLIEALNVSTVYWNTYFEWNEEEQPKVEVDSWYTFETQNTNKYVEDYEKLITESVQASMQSISAFKAKLEKSLLQPLTPTFTLNAKQAMQVVGATELDYAGMLNWLQDLPSGTNAKKNFEEMLDILKTTHEDEPIQVLEVGTFVGTSLIGILDRLPSNTTAVAIDAWKDYNELDPTTNKNGELLQTIEQNRIEDIFKRNMKISGMEKRVRAMKGDSGTCLLQLIESKEKFDFIYVDASHKLADCYLDCCLSWKLLRVNGILGIDDYLFLRDVNIVESPFEAVNHFLDKYKDDYILLHKDYRVFLLKVKDD